MKTTILLAAALAVTTALPVFAQANSVTGVRQLDDQIDDIDRDARRDLNRGEDASRFNQNGVAQGFQGSAALTASGTSGNSDDADLSLAGRLTLGQGDISHLFGFAAEYSEADGETDEETFFGTYEGSYYFNPRLYAYGTGRYIFDSDDGNRQDAFLGLGLGYRIVNTPEFAWRVQGGPGVRYIQTNSFTDEQTGEFFPREDDTEVAALVSSRFFYTLTETVALTNDTDILGSSSDYTLQNDFGVNFRVSDTFSTRISYRTDFESDPQPGFKNTDNTLGISLIVGF